MGLVSDKQAHIIVQGTVQGVGYRYFTLKTARELGILGWVRNREDGSVELEVEGEEDTIKDFAADIGRKHPWAKIQNIEIQWKPFEGKYQNFEISH